MKPSATTTAFVMALQDGVFVVAPAMAVAPEATTSEPAEAATPLIVVGAGSA